MFADHLIENIPHFRLFFFNQLLGLFDSRRQSLRIKARIDEGLEQFERHLFRQTALMQFQFGTHHDHRTAGIVDALAEQVLTETTLLAFEHIGKRFQRTLIGTGNDTTAATIVKQRIDRLLQHTLFVADDDVGCAQFDQTLQAIVAVDDATIEIVQIRGCEAAAIERNQRTQIRRDHRNDRQDHPFRLVAGLHEGLDDLQPLGQFLRLQFRGRDRDFMPQISGGLFKIELDQNFADRFRADHGGEAVFAIFVLCGQIIIFRQQLEFFERGQTRFDHAVIFEVKNLFQILQRHVEQQTDARRQRLQKPDMGDRRCQFDMAHAVTPHARQGDFHAAFFADDAFIFHPLIFAAQTFVILDRAKDTGAEQTIALRLEGAVIDGLRLLDFAIGPGKNFFRA